MAEEIWEEAIGGTWDSWEDVRYRKAQALRDGGPFGYIYILDENGDWHKHDAWGWHRVSRVHRGAEG